MSLFAFDVALAPFVVAIGVMLLLALVQVASLGGFDFPDPLEGADGASTLLDWLNAGRLPIMILLILGLTLFGILGLALQGLAQAVAGSYLPPLLSVPGALLGAVPATNLLGRTIGRLIPRLETTAVGRDSLVGLRATVMTGVAREGLPAPARVRDRLGGLHQVLVEPEAGGDPLTQGGEVLLLRQVGETFRAMPVAPHPFLTPEGDVAL